MDDLRFDAWTRRRFGLAVGGFSAALYGLIDPVPARAKKKRKKCKKTEKRCGKKCVKGTCCPGKSCGETCTCLRAVEGQGFCARELQVACSVGLECSSSQACGPSTRCAQSPCPPPDTRTLCVPVCNDE